MQKLTAIIEVHKHDGEMELVVGRDLTHDQINSLVLWLEMDNRRAKLLATYGSENIRVVDASQISGATPESPTTIRRR
jgi:hypothetical protein